MHQSGIGRTREKRVEQSVNHDPSILDYANYVPIGKAVEKVKSWQEQGNEIIYLSSREDAVDVAKDKLVLDKFNFPKGPILYRRNGEAYKDVIERIKPDILIEDDCESIGGEKEMCITYVYPELKKQIRSIVVKEFNGIDDLSKEI